jgi:hypothetical protein
MNKIYGVVAAIIIVFLCCIYAGVAMSQKKEVMPAPNGIHLPENYRDWKTISVSHRTDNNTIRAILGNEIAIQAVRSGQTNPWPDGSVLAKIVWQDTVHEQWSSATIPGKYLISEFMIKDANKYSATGGWGFARWLGMEQQPYGKNADFVQECFSCHIPMKKNDYVYTHPAVMP